ncbi:MAG TPA: hypothetical protein VN873_14730 [Candidatus Angelobacter sp.]|nr:hypothetical protein [Candidatus Angelobacter sp.]
MKEFDPIHEKSWRKLTAAEEAEVRAWLEKHPEAGRDLEADRVLTQALAKLPDAPVPGNFTSRVLQTLEREAKTASRPPARPWFPRLLAPRAAIAAAVVGVALLSLSYHEHTAALKQRAELVQGVKVVAGVSSLPSPEILQDFDTIRQMGTTPGPDPELIALLK